MTDNEQDPVEIVLERDLDDDVVVFDRTHQVRPLLGRVQARDFVYISLTMKGIGWTFLLLGFITSRFDTHAGYGMMGVATLFLLVGIGLARYRIWAWYAGLVLLIGVSAIVTIGILFMLASRPRAVSILLVPAGFLMLIRAMVSKDGRDRYRRAAEARAKARANPDSLAARAMRA